MVNNEGIFKRVALEEVLENPDNPRNITEYKLDSLVDSILGFPRMLELRPIVVDECGVSLGGNMRRKGLELIGKLTDEQLNERVGRITEVKEKRAALLKYWTEWRKKKVVAVVYAADLTEEQKREFIIKDNVAFGVWDQEKLAGWERDQLEEWGLDDIQWEKETLDEDGVEEGKKSISTKLQVECEDVEKLASLFSELQDRGFNCELI